MSLLTQRLSCNLRHGGQRLSFPVQTGKLTYILSMLNHQFVPVGHDNGLRLKLHILASAEGSKFSGCTPISSQQFHTTPCVCVELKTKTGLEDSFAILGVEDDCTDQELKNAYLEKAKAYHPDSARASSNAGKFTQVKEAYKTVLEHRKGRALEQEEEEEVGSVFDIKHTAPQHRQYLEFGGIGFGTPSQRQHQYQQYRVVQVTENVFQHRMQKLASETENALVVKDKQEAKKAVISNAIDRIVEDLIQESMKRGDFNNLPGQGRPLEYSAHNPFVDTTTHNLNKVLVNNGFAPEWIMLQSEIRKEIQQARQILALTNHRLKNSCSTKGAKEWRTALDNFKQKINDINGKIHKFNLIVPFLTKQKVIYNVDREVKRVLDDIESYLPEDDNAHLVWDVSLSQTAPLSSSSSQPIDFRQVWRDIKEVFRLSAYRNT